MQLNISMTYYLECHVTCTELCLDIQYKIVCHCFFNSNQEQQISSRDLYKGKTFIKSRWCCKLILIRQTSWIYLNMGHSNVALKILIDTENHIHTEQWQSQLSKWRGSFEATSQDVLVFRCLFDWIKIRAWNPYAMVTVLPCGFRKERISRYAVGVANSGDQSCIL